MNDMKNDENERQIVFNCNGFGEYKWGGGRYIDAP